MTAAADQLGYTPSPSAVSLSTGRKGAIGILAPWLSRWFFAAAIEGIQQTLRADGYDLLLYPAGSTAPLGARSVDLRALSKRVDGVIALNVPFVDKVPIVMPGVSIGGLREGFGAVRVDDVAVGRIATEHLLELGHRRIAFIGTDPDAVFGFTSAADRLAGYLGALAAVGASPDPGWVRSSGFAVEGGTRCLQELFVEIDSGSVRRPTAVFAVSDEVAMGVLHAARLRGLRVPEELSVVGVDDHDLAYLFDLTTVAQPVRLQGARAARMLMDRITDPTLNPCSALLDVGLVIRGTTAAPVRLEGSA